MGSNHISQDDAIAMIRQLVRKHKSQMGAARALDISASYLGDILKGARPVSDGVARKLGYTKVVLFEKVEGDDE